MELICFGSLFFMALEVDAANTNIILSYNKAIEIFQDLNVYSYVYPIVC